MYQEINKKVTAFHENAKKTNAPAAIRTRDPLLRRQVLYPPELQAQETSNIHSPDLFLCRSWILNIFQ